MTEGYTYDAIYQLTQVTQGANTTEWFNYDQVGNRTASHLAASYTVNSSNQLTADSNASYTYDNNGNTLTKTVGTNVTTYGWDLENRLISVQLPNSGGTVSYKYDPFGRRIYRSAQSGTTIWNYDGANIIEERDGAGSLLARYTQGTGVDEPLAMLRGGSTYSYEQDGLGSVTSLSNASGSIAESYIYDSYGKVLAGGTNLANPFQYTAREWDSLISIYYYRNRYYDGGGRFLSEDPVSFFGGMNFYRYVDNAPATFIDSDGLSPKPLRPPNQRWRRCNSSETAECTADCAKRGKTLESCMVSETFRLTRIMNGHRKYEWKSAPPSCSCSEDDDPRKCKRGRKGFGLYTGPTDFELQRTIDSANHLVDFWGWIVVGDTALGIVGTAGAFGVFGGVAGGGAAAASGGGAAAGTTGTTAAPATTGALIPAA